MTKLSDQPSFEASHRILESLTKDLRIHKQQLGVFTAALSNQKNELTLTTNYLQRIEVELAELVKTQITSIGSYADLKAGKQSGAAYLDILRSQIAETTKQIRDIEGKVASLEAQQSGIQKELNSWGQVLSFPRQSK